LRLQRYGIRAPRLLAFGQRCVSGCCLESFLLTEPPPGAIRLGQWFRQHAAAVTERRHVIQATAELLRRIHDLHYYLAGISCFAVMQQDPQSTPVVVLTSIDGLHSRRHPSRHEAWKDLAAVYHELFAFPFRQTDGLRFVLSYLGLPKLNRIAKRLTRSLLRPFHSPAIARGTVELPASGSVRLQTAGQGGVP
jgi:hypothetical protein